MEGTMRWVTCPHCGERTFSTTLGDEELLRRHVARACPTAPRAYIDVDATVVDLTDTAVTAQPDRVG